MWNCLLMLGVVLLLVVCVQLQLFSDVVWVCDDCGCVDWLKVQVVFDQVNIFDEDLCIVVFKEVVKWELKVVYDLGLCYFCGDGVCQDSYQVLNWMCEVVEYGNLQV